MERLTTVEGQRWCEYSPEFKAMVLVQVRERGASVGGVALSHKLHSNMVQR